MRPALAVTMTLHVPYRAMRTASPVAVPVRTNALHVIQEPTGRPRIPANPVARVMRIDPAHPPTANLSAMIIHACTASVHIRTTD